MHARSCSKVNAVLVHHRKNRPGQTIGNFEGPGKARMFAYFAFFERVGKAVFESPEHRDNEVLPVVVDLVYLV